MSALGGYVSIPTAVMRNRDLPLAARVLFGVILSYAWGENPCTATTETLCEDVGIGRSTLYESLTSLRAAGLIRVESEARSKRIYPIAGSVRIPDSEPLGASGIRNGDREVVLSLSLDQDGEAQNGSKLRLLDEKLLEPSREGARARPKPMTYGRLKVPTETAEMAERLLATFNDATGSNLGGRKADGSPTGHLKQIVGAVMDREGEASEADWHAAIRNTAANPPQWVEGRRLTLGHVFGARAADHALANTGAVAIGIAAGNPVTRPGRVDWGAVAETLEAQGL
jgi:DNA-binding transcriptional ArsR family regulator